MPKNKTVKRAKPRERLYAATIAVVAEKGYESSRISDLVQAAGASRNTFYRNFEDKHACVCATIDAVVDTVSARMLSAYRERRGSCDVRLGAALETLIELVISEPAAAKLCCVDAYAAGPVALGRVARLEQLLEQIVADAVKGSGAACSAPPPEALRTILGGLKLIIHSRVRSGREHELLRLEPEMLQWALSYAVPARAALEPSLLDLCGTAATAAARPWDLATDARERMLTAVTELVVTKGYPATTIADIADSASVSLTTFYKHFSSKEEALIAATTRGEQLLLADVTAAYLAAPNWPLAVRAGLRAFLTTLAANPGFARLGVLDVFSGPGALEWRASSIAKFEALLAPGYEDYPRTPAIAAEAVSAAIAAGLYEALTASEPDRLPEMAPLATFIALAPFVGVRDARAIATTSDSSGDLQAVGRP